MTSPFRGLHLSERASLLPKLASPPPRERKQGLDRLTSWSHQNPFQEGEWLEKRLAQEGLSPEQFVTLLSRDESDFADAADLPPWWHALDPLFAAQRPDGSGRATDSLPLGAFAEIIRPLIEQSMAKVTDVATSLKAAHPDAPYDPQGVSDLLWQGMTNTLDWILSRTVVLELYIAKAQQKLQGENPAQRFSFFIQGLCSAEARRSFFEEYPVLGRIVVDELRFWEETSCELLSRLSEDWGEISQLTTLEDPGLLSAVEGAGGDRHCRGRTVRILNFDSGFRVVYKPRSVAVNGRFSELLDWLNERGAPDLQAVTTIEKEGYGWVEFLVSKPCSDDSEIESFYFRQGSFLALFYMLHAIDFHRENLIAYGEHPIFIDLECLFGPDYSQLQPSTYDSLAHFELNTSVMQMMLLPFFLGNQEQDVQETSGLGGTGDQVSIHAVSKWENPGTDEMKLVKERPNLDEAENRPMLEGEATNPSDYREPLERGFSSMYRLLIELREELLSTDSPLRAFEDTEIRIVFRASQFYAFVLDSSFHPNLLRNAVDRDQHLDRMWYGINQTTMPEVSLRLLPHERKDLWAGDIPLFSTQVGSHDVRNSQGEVLPDFLQQSGQEVVFSRLQAFDEEDLQKQLWFIRASLTAVAMENSTHSPLVATPLPELAEDRSPGKRTYERVAAAAAQRLSDLAMRESGKASWLGLAKTRAKGWWLRPLSSDLYAGLPGVSIFLAQAGQVLGEPNFTTLAREALRTLDHQLERHDNLRFVGAYDGWGGLLYTWLYLGQLWQDEELLERADHARTKIAKFWQKDQDLDLVRGSVGGIPPLLSLYELTGSGEALDLARQLGDWILEKAHPFEDGICWFTESFPVHPLTGLSHGNAGFAWSLLSLHDALGDDKYLDAARKALRFESRFFSKRTQNWMDLRPIQTGLGSADYESECAYSTSWCHGAVGVGLSRIELMRYLDAAEVMDDLEIAVETAIRTGFGENHCLCHGDLGNLELVLRFQEISKDPVLEGRTENLIAGILDGIAEGGFRSGVPYYVETPGLMEGIAGIGYGFLRLATEGRLPSVLTLQLPPGNP